MIDLKDIKKDRIFVYCYNLQQYIKFMKYLDKRNIFWISGTHTIVDDKITLELSLPVYLEIRRFPILGITYKYNLEALRSYSHKIFYDVRDFIK